MVDSTSNGGITEPISPTGSPINKPWSPTEFHTREALNKLDAKASLNVGSSGQADNDNVGVLQSYFSQNPDKVQSYAQAITSWHRDNKLPLNLNVADLEQGLSSNALSPAMRQAITAFEATPRANDWRQTNLDTAHAEAYERATQQQLTPTVVSGLDPKKITTVDEENIFKEKNDITDKEHTKIEADRVEQSGTKFDFETAALVDKYHIAASNTISSEHAAISTSQDLNGLEKTIAESIAAPNKNNESPTNSPENNLIGSSKNEPSTSLSNNIDTRIAMPHAVDWSQPDVTIPNEDGSGNSIKISRDPKTGTIQNIQHQNADGQIISPKVDEQNKLNLPNQPAIDQNHLRV